MPPSRGLSVHQTVPDSKVICVVAVRFPFLLSGMVYFTWWSLSLYVDKNKDGIHKEAVTQLLKRRFLKDVELYTVFSSSAIGYLHYCEEKKGV